jgi:hypothetical protein
MDTTPKTIDVAARIRRPVPDVEIPALRLACLRAALAAVSNDAGRMTGVHRDISRMIQDDPEFRRQRAEWQRRQLEPVEREYYGKLGAVRSD